jgi:hypothetical protein
MTVADFLYFWWQGEAPLLAKPATVIDRRDIGRDYNRVVNFDLATARSLVS